MENNTFEQLQTLIVERLGVDSADVTMEASFTNDLGADSLDVVEFIMEMEDAFNIEIPDADAEKLLTVKDAVDYINEVK